MTERAFVDTNVWVYAVDAADPVKRAVARAITAPEVGRDLVISSQVLSEFYTVVTRKLAAPLPGLIAAAMIDKLSDLPVVAVDAELVKAAVEGCREWRISLWDALIVRAAEVSGCRTLITEDLAHGETYGSVRVADPFAGGR